MSKISLRAAFALGRESRVAAQQVFTDRVSEVGAFAASLAALGDSLAAADVSPVVDRRLPRRNVLVYYGVGGIGKSTLSQELERRFVETGKGKPARAAVRFDFAEPSAFDLESVVLRLRAGLGHLARSWPVFDVAFSVYWERAHPGEPLDEFISRDSALRRVAHAIGLSEQITSAVVEVAGAALPGVARAAHSLGGLVYGQAKKAVVRHRTLSKCELLPELLDADADVETLSYFPYLLAWDLARRPAPGLRTLVLLDTFEEVTGRGTRDMERWVQRCVFLMPNVLFVVTGRNRLDWADPARAADLDFAGPLRWPYLVAGHAGGEPRQHLVGYLSAADADSYLAAALTEDDRPAIPAPIRARIVAASGGLPLYLDLAVTAFLDILARGGTPGVDDFGQPLPAVLAKILRDLSRDERDLLRAAALVGSFDPAMLKAACPHVPDAVLARFAARPFLELDPDRTWRLSLHAIVREAIRAADSGLADSWSPRERAQVAGRIGDHLRRVAVAAAEGGDRGMEVAAAGQAIGLCVLTGLFFEWLVAAAQRLLAAGGWGLLPDEVPGAGGPVAALLLGLRGARERRSGQVERSAELLDAALGEPGLPGTLRRFLLLHRAHALRVAGRYADGAADYTVLWREPGEFRLDAGYWLADYGFLQGRFGAALADLDQIDGAADVPAELRGEILRLRGHIYRVNALFDRAEAAYRAALELARGTANLAAEGKALTDLMQTLAWRRPADAREIGPRAVEVNEALRNQVEIVKIRAADAVALAGLGESGEAGAEIERGLALTRDCGYPGGQVWCQVARAYSQLRQGEPGAARETAARVAAITAGLGGNRFWAEITAWQTAAGPGQPPPEGTADWLDGADAARARWLAVLPEDENHGT